jgi:two-component system alkaline phosphatase synthesis response regulator PhoP
MEAEIYKILIVDDEHDILEFLSYNLKKEGYMVYTASNGERAVEKAKEVIPHLILLDVMMPKMDGITTCEELRKINELNSSVIAFLTARSEEYSEIAGFSVGADDYISKPIRPKVLIARIQALLKRFSGKSTNHISNSILTINNISIDKDRHIVIVDGLELSLPNKEFKLLKLLASKPERVFTRDEIYNEIWGSDAFVGDRTIDVHIRKLREKIGEDYFETIKGIGYKFTLRF